MYWLKINLTLILFFVRTTYNIDYVVSSRSDSPQTSTASPTTQSSLIQASFFVLLGLIFFWEPSPGQLKL